MNKDRSLPKIPQFRVHLNMKNPGDKALAEKIYSVWNKYLNTKASNATALSRLLLDEGCDSIIAKNKGKQKS